MPLGGCLKEEVARPNSPSWGLYFTGSCFEVWVWLKGSSELLSAWRILFRGETCRTCKVPLGGRGRRKGGDDRARVTAKLRVEEPW